jgi:hypothetical protein
MMLVDALTVNVRQAHRLVTHEDGRFLHAHKLMGVVALGNFAYRGYVWYRRGADRGLGGLDDGSWATLALLAVHLALHLTSFQFVLPRRRNLAYNTVWPEMRWHSLIFAGRSIFAMGLLWLHRNGAIGAGHLYLGRVFAVMSTLVLADVVTAAFKGDATSSESKTIRDNPFPAWVPEEARRWVALSYSTAQIFATCMVLFREESTLFWTLLPIQMAPLLMTLVKKGILTPAGWHVWYAASIAVNCFFDPPVPVGGPCPSLQKLVAVAALLRFFLRIDKYVLWAAVAAWGAHPDLVNVVLSLRWPFVSQ